MTKQQALERAAAYDAALKMLGASGGIVGPPSQANPSMQPKHERKQSKETAGTVAVDSDCAAPWERQGSAGDVGFRFEQSTRNRSRLPMDA